MERGICTHCNMEKKLKIFTTSIQNVKFVKVIEVKNVTMRTTINYQINEKHIMRKIEINYYKNKTIDI